MQKAETAVRALLYKFLAPDPELQVAKLVSPMDLACKD